MDCLLDGTFPPVIPCIITSSQTPKTGRLKISKNLATELGYSGKSLEEVLSLDNLDVIIKHLYGPMNSTLVLVDASAALAVKNYPLNRRILHALPHMFKTEQFRYTPEQWADIQKFAEMLSRTSVQSSVVALLAWAHKERAKRAPEGNAVSETVETAVSDTHLDGDLGYTLRGSMIKRVYSGEALPRPDELLIAALAGPGVAAYFFDTSNFSVKLTSVKIDPAADIPNKEAWLASALKSWSQRNTWICDPPTSLEFGDKRAMYEALNKHLDGLGIIVTGLSLRNIVYMSDGNFELSPDAYPRTYKCPANFYCPEWHDREDYESIYNVLWTSDWRHRRPMLYAGQAWCVTIAPPGTKVFAPDLHIYFAEPDQYINAYKNIRPEFAEEFEKDPWGDGFIFICSDWCQRNGTANYHRGIDLLTPRRRHCSLREWITTDYVQRAAKLGIKLLGATVYHYNGVPVTPTGYNKLLTELSQKLAEKTVSVEAGV